MDALLTTDGLIALVTLTAMEIVLGIDNVVFIAILTGRLPLAQQATARRLGLSLALMMRIGLLFAISWIMGLTRPFVTVFAHGFSGRDAILLGGGLFLIFKATWEIYDKLEVSHAGATSGARARAFASVLVQILILDIVFSLDSVITAVGMANDVIIMVIAMVIAMVVMLVSAGPIGGFVERHPSVKILALSFLLLIGVMLVAEGMGSHMSKAYIYFGMAFSLFVELLNMRYRRTQKPLALHGRFEEGTAPPAQGGPGGGT
jgi:predicted tellurium resistance membrane protein TerC